MATTQRGKSDTPRPRLKIDYVQGCQQCEMGKRPQNFRKCPLAWPLYVGCQKHPYEVDVILYGHWPWLGAVSWKHWQAAKIFKKLRRKTHVTFWKWLFTFFQLCGCCVLWLAV